MNDVGFNIINPDVTGIAFLIGLKSVITNTGHDSFMIRLKFGKAGRILISEEISTKKVVKCSENSSLQSSH